MSNIRERAALVDKVAAAMGKKVYSGETPKNTTFRKDLQKVQSKVVTLEDAIRLSGLKDGMTISFHHHFRQLAGMSPLRYQKWLRLNEARRLMLNEHYDVTTAAYAVGYESLSHFSREYTRMFGESPKRDITVLRTSAGKI